MSLLKERNAFEKDVLLELRKAVKSTPWRMKQHSVFRAVEDFFVVAYLRVYLNDSKNIVSLYFKPMALDPLYWRIVGLEDNEAEPLSFRAWGAFCCDEIPLGESELKGNAETVASSFLDWIDSRVEELVPKFVDTDFSEIVSNQENHIERGAYAISLVVSLIKEKKYNSARLLAQAFLDGTAKSTGQHTHLGKNFHELAIEWIDSNACDE